MTSPTILLIEDSPTYAELATILLSRCGCAVLVAATALDGLRLADARSPDLIIIDHNLPGMGGFDAARSLRGSPHTAAIPLLALTADDVSVANERAARAAGFDAFITKPFDQAAFCDAVAALIPLPRFRP